MATVAPYGSWKSPISAAVVAAGRRPLDQVRLAGGSLYWVEGRPAEGGRNVLLRQEGDGARALTPEGLNVRTRVHEYGGGAYTVHGGSVFFANFADQRVYRQDGTGQPRAISPEPAVPAGDRYADFCPSPDGRWLYCVREVHDAGGTVTNTLAALPADGVGSPRTLASGRDFYAYPRVSPDGRRLAWTCWDHPNMPWDGCELWVGDVNSDGEVDGARLVAGGREESIFQPAWSPAGQLYFVSDRTGWWALYRLGVGRVESVLAVEGAELGVAQWVFGLATYAFLADGRIACTYSRRGIDHLGLLDAQGRFSTLDLPYTAYSAQLQAAANHLAFIAAAPDQASAVVVLDVGTGQATTVARSLDVEVDPGCVSRPEPVEFPTEGGRTAHALFYRPANAGFEGLQGELPPLLVVSHGGPTSMARAALDLGTQFWTSRGFAVVDVNYGGSTGYGRAYRQRLKGQWGVVDVQDCINAAKHLARQGLVDGRRLAIRGGSAGGYTTLCALTFHDDFAAGASYYGVADCEALARDTHKFESRYLDGLIGPYPQAQEVYRQRSPIHYADRLSCPVILFQGLEDRIVPPSQAEAMAEALRRKGLPFAYLAFEGEQHGFRKAETIQRTLEAELYFYSRVFGFQPADAIAPVAIENEAALGARRL